MNNRNLQNLASENSSPQTLAELVEFLTAHNIYETYDFLQYDYGQECANELGQNYSAERAAFIKQFNWTFSPTSQIIRRVFNQINTYYAERWAYDNPNVDPFELLIEINRLALYRQGKTIGLRSRSMAFGVRKDLDVLDPRRQFKWLRGIAPEFIGEAITEWSRSIKEVRPNLDTALFLMMALIAIHPFSDGNGRVARVVFTWLTKRWGIQEQWLAEDQEGEFLRTGTGIHSTEHYMGMFMLAFCGGFNRKEYGFHEEYSDRDAEQAFLAAQSRLRAVVENDKRLMNDESFMALKAHLELNNHFKFSSPRFESLAENLE
jgi:hypothetical protein